MFPAQGYERLVLKSGNPPLLSRRETLALVRRVQNGTKVLPSKSDEDKDGAPVAVSRSPAALAAREKLLRHNLGFVVHLALQIQRKWGSKAPIEFFDAVQEGAIGFLHAVDKFDPGFDCKLQTYAAYWVRACITNAYLAQRLDRVPNRVNHALVKMAQLMRKQDLSFDEALELVATSLGRRKDLKQAAILRRKQISLDAPIMLTEEGEADGYTLLADPESDPDKLQTARDAREELGRLAVFLHTLSDREQAIILNRTSDKTLEEVGELYAVTRERIRQIQSRALRRLESLRRQSSWRFLKLLGSAPFLTVEEFWAVCQGRREGEGRRICALRETIEKIAARLRSKQSGLSRRHPRSRPSKGEPEQARSAKSGGEYLTAHCRAAVGDAA